MPEPIMACYHPIPALQLAPGGPVKLWPPIGTANLQLPCSKCIGCRTDRASEWAQRCAHEATQWPTNIFVTLTYDDAHLPAGGDLEPGHLRNFIKRLRKSAIEHSSRYRRDSKSGIRYLASGEYGSKGKRPHYHALFFNLDFADRRRTAADLYESPTLSALWGNGQVRFGDATPAAAAYIAQYNIKKIGTGEVLDPDTGLIRRPPFLRMSLKPAIGSQWLAKYKTDLQHGYLVTDTGRKMKVPRTYVIKLEEQDPELHESIKLTAEKHRQQNIGDHNDPERQRAAELIHFHRKQLTERRKL